MTAGRSVVAVANEQVSIVTVCQMLGVELSDDIGESRSRKVHCPFGELYHSDHGAAPAMRIYSETNSVYCFNCSAYDTPVSLAAKAMDVDKHLAATRLLERIGYRPLDMATAWKQAREYEPAPDTALLADALKTYCRRVTPGWAQRQFEPAVAATLTKCLSALGLVRTAVDVSAWLSTCKIVMTRALDIGTPSERKDHTVS